MNKNIDELIEKYANECINENLNTFDSNEKCNKLFRHIQKKMLPKLCPIANKNKLTSAGFEPTKPP